MVTMLVLSRSSAAAAGQPSKGIRPDLDPTVAILSGADQTTPASSDATAEDRIPLESLEGDGLATFERWLESTYIVFLVGVAVLIILYAIVPFVLYLGNIVSRTDTDTSSFKRYNESFLRDFLTPLVLMGSAFLLAMTVAFFAMGSFLVSDDRLFRSASERGLESAEVLALSQTILGFVALIIALTTGGAGLVILKLRQISTEAAQAHEGSQKAQSEVLSTSEELGAQVEKAIHKLQNTQESIEENLAENRDSIQREIKEALGIVEVQSRETIGRFSKLALMTCEVALAKLPDIAFTQQIPYRVLRNLQPIHDLFSDEVLGEAVDRSLRSTGNGATIRFAQAIHRYSWLSDPTRSADRIKAADQLLEAASKTADADLRLSIYIRRALLCRQERRFDDCRVFIDAIRADDDLGIWSASVPTAIANWLEAMSDIGASLHSDRSSHAEQETAERDRHARLAFLNMDGVFKQAFGWPDWVSRDDGQLLELPSTKSKQEDLAASLSHLPASPSVADRLQGSPSVAYYTAKAALLARSTFPADLGAFKEQWNASELKGKIPIETFERKLWYSSEFAIRLLLGRLSGQQLLDVTERSIYRFCSLFCMLGLRDVSSTVEHDHPWLKPLFEPGTVLLGRQVPEYKRGELEDYWSEMADSLSEQLVHSLDSLDAEANTRGLIYSEGHEALVRVSEYKELAQQLKQYVADAKGTQKMDAFAYLRRRG